MEKNRFFFLGFFSGALLILLLLAGIKTSAWKAFFLNSEKADKAKEKPGLDGHSLPLTPPYRYVDKAPVTITEYADFHCPYSRQAAASLKKIMIRYPTTVRMIFRHFPSPLSSAGSAGAFLTHEASLCAHEQGKFWPFHDALFALPKPPKESDLEPIAQRAGVELSRFQECLKTGKYRDNLNQEIQRAKEDQVSGTPTFVIQVANEYRSSGAFVAEQFEQLIDGILNPGEKEIRKAQVPSAPGGTPSAQAAGERPGSEKPPSPKPAKPVSFNDLEGKPSLGPKKAPITLVEFSDFHCPFCKRVGPTVEQLMEHYPKKIRRVWRHFPLSFHRGADRTHEASECAAEQGKFWEYHDKLFENQGTLTGEDKMLIGLAAETGLDKKKFEECLARGKYKDRIQKDIAVGEASGVRGTPAFFINGNLVSGAQPYENFEKVVQDELAKKS